MKQLRKNLMHKIAQLFEEGVLGIICLHETSIFPIGTGSFMPTTYPGEEARMIASMAHLKQETPRASGAPSNE